MFGAKLFAVPFDKAFLFAERVTFTANTAAFLFAPCLQTKLPAAVVPREMNDRPSMNDH